MRVNGITVDQVTETRWKVGRVRIDQIGDDHYQILYYNPRRSVTTHHLAFKVIVKIASEINLEIQMKKAGLKSAFAANKAPALWKGFDEAQAHSNARKRHSHCRRLSFTKFVDWLAGHFPDVENWGQLKPMHVQSYIKDLEAMGRAYWTIKGRIEPIRQAWHAMAANYPDAVGMPPPFRLRGCKVDKHEKDCLAPHEFAIVLQWLKEHAPLLYPIATLQVFCGLRMLEAASLRVKDVDLIRGTLEITKTDIHEPKNAASYRTLPLPPCVLEILRPLVLKAQHAKRLYLFTNNRGNPISRDVLVHRFQRAWKHLGATPSTLKREVTGRPLPIHPHGLSRPDLVRCPPHRLRSSFTSMLIGRVERELRQLYMGHGGSDTLAAHYDVMNIETLRPVALAVEKVASEMRQSAENETAQAIDSKEVA